MRRLWLIALPLLSLVAPAHASPEHAEIAFVSDGSVWAARADGSERRRLVAGKDLAQPVWSPDGSRLAYVRGEGERAQLMLLDTSGSRAVTPLRKRLVDQAPAWSPDGSAIAFSRFAATGERYRTSIVVRDVASSTERVLVSMPLLPRFTSVGEPAWSPDGGTIAYTQSALDREHDFDPSVRAVPAQGGASRVLLSDAQSPAWSPDGSRLAFASVRDRNGKRCGSDECWFAGELYTAAADGSGLTRLTRNEGDDGAPRWSPDGSRILFSSDRSLPEGDSSEVYSVAADGTCLTWVTNGTPASAFATWRPGTGTRYDPGDCDPASRTALAETPELPSVRGGLWLGPGHRGLLLSTVRRGLLDYADCDRFDRCPERILLHSEPACRPRTHRGIEQFRLVRMRGALVAYHSPEAVARVLSGHAATSIQLGGRNRLADVRRVVRSLRPYGASDAGRRLAAPRLPRALARRLGVRRYTPC